MDRKRLIDSAVNGNPINPKVLHGLLSRQPDRPKLSCIYFIKCTANGRIYIGSSVDVFNRWVGHRWNLRHNKHHSRYLQNAWNRYGESEFYFQIIEIAPAAEIRKIEARYLKLHKDNVMNVGLVRPNGLVGISHSDETKRKMSMAHVGRVGVMQGKHHSPETRARISEGQRWRDPSTWRRGGDHGCARPVEIDGVTYPAVSIAAVALGVDTSTAIARLQRGMGRYLDDHNSQQTVPWGLEEKTGSKHKNARAVFVGNLRFDCCKDAAAHFGIHPASFIEWIQKGKARYADGLPPMRIGPKPRKPKSAADIKQHWRMRPIIVDGVTYRAQRVAAQEIGVSKSSIENWLKSGRAAYAPT